MNTELLESPRDLLGSVVASGQDYEWYPTTQRMIDVVKSQLPENAASIMDIGAGDGRVLTGLAEKCKEANLYAIEKSNVLVQAQPENVVPVGTEFYEQNLACLQVDFIFCNPPYSQFEQWAARIIESGYARRAYLIIPQRWEDSREIKAALTRRGATAKAIHSDDFLDAERRARAVVHIVEIRYPVSERSYRDDPKDPFDIWFDQNIDTFDASEGEPANDQQAAELARKHSHSTIGDMVTAYLEEYTRMEANYKAIFKLDHALLKELGVSKENVREGIKKKMAGLKAKYWEVLFDRLDAITTRLSTKTKERFLKKLTGNTSIAFTSDNAYAVVLWAIKNANKYYDEQLVTLFRELSTFEGVHNYKSNQRTWQKNGWRYSVEDHDHYSLDYRIVVSRYTAIKKHDSYGFDCYNNLHKGCHELIGDTVAVMSNLGYTVAGAPSKDRQWIACEWQDFITPSGDTLFQVKAHINGNLHFRFMPEAIRRLNVEAGRLLGWLQNAGDVVRELEYTPDEATRFFGANIRIAPSNVKMLTAQTGASA